MKRISPSELDRRVGELRDACRAEGLRLTHQRLEIFREVARSDEHPDADTLFQRVREKMPTVSHDTVYRTLASLEAMGLVRRVENISGRARYDANTEPHHHFVCTRCGGIADFYLKSAPPLPEGIDDLGSAESLHLQVRGICRKCMNQQT